MQKLFYSSALLGLAILVCCGCGGDTGPKTHPVKGKVTRKGSPVPGVAVTFIPESGSQGAVGVTNDSGEYQLTTRAKDDGAVAGSYKVTLAKYEGAATDAPAGESKANPSYDVSNEYPEGYDESKASTATSKNVLPEKYSVPETSGFTADVKEGGGTFDFEIPD